MSSAQTTQVTGKQPVKTEMRREENRNRIQISSSKKTLSFYVYLAKKFLADEEVVELSGLGNAINTVVSCAEILKNSGAAIIKKIETSSVQMPSGRQTNRTVSKAKIQVFVSKSKDFLVIMEKEKQEQAKRLEEKQKKEAQAGSTATATATTK